MSRFALARPQLGRSTHGRRVTAGVVAVALVTGLVGGVVAPSGASDRPTRPAAAGKDGAPKADPGHRVVPSGVRTPRPEPSRRLPKATFPSGSGSAVLQAGSSWTAVSGLPLQVRPHAASSGRTSAPATGAVTMSLTPMARAAGVLLTAATDSAEGAADVRLDYSGFAAAHGGGWASRLKVWAYPACYASTPNVPACAAATPVTSSNDPDRHTVDFTTTATTATIRRVR